MHTDFPAADTSVLNLFLPCPAGVQDYLAEEVARITGGNAQDLRTSRGGVALQGNWETVQRLNLHSRLAQRVLIELAHAPYRQEADLYETALALPWENWFGIAQTFKIDLTAQASPLQSLNFAALKIKDAVADRFRQHTGARPNVETHYPDVRLHAHLTRDRLTLYIDSSGEPLFKRGWRQDTGDAPLKETLAAAILAASGWTPDQPLYDPCCGSGTIAIEAAQIAAGIAPGSMRSFGFERLKPFVRADWLTIKEEAAQAGFSARNAKNMQKITIFGSDVAHRMVDFAQRNAERAGVADWLEFRGGDALQRQAPIDQPGLIVLNPPYGERIETGGFAASDLDFFVQLAAHWKQGFGGWTAWVLSPDFKLPGHMHLAENRKIPMWNGPIECRLFRFEVQTAGGTAGAAENEAP
jgi:putative N6-adenine-specific DNA methylase